MHKQAQGMPVSTDVEVDSTTDGSSIFSRETNTTMTSTNTYEHPSMALSPREAADEFVSLMSAEDSLGSLLQLLMSRLQSSKTFSSFLDSLLTHYCSELKCTAENDTDSRMVTILENHQERVVKRLTTLYDGSNKPAIMAQLMNQVPGETEEEMLQGLTNAVKAVRDPDSIDELQEESEPARLARN